MSDYYVYIMTNNSGTLYVGVTNDLERRCYEHKQGVHSGFTKRYKLTRLVYYESTPDVAAAIEREKEIKGWVRRKKFALIASVNPYLEGLERGVDRGSARPFAESILSGVARFFAALRMTESAGLRVTGGDTHA